MSRFLSFLDKLSANDIKKLENGTQTIEYTLNQLNIRDKSGINKSEHDISSIIDKLNLKTSREDAESFLKSNDLKRSDYEIILKKLDLPFLKKDNISKLIDKIVEGTIGFKLRSQAIQDK